MANHYGNHKCHLEKYITIVFILPSRWQDDAESLGIETASCLFHKGTEWFFKNKNTEQLTLTTRKNDSTNPLQCSSLSPCCLKQRRSAKTTTRTTNKIDAGTADDKNSVDKFRRGKSRRATKFSCCGSFRSVEKLTSWWWSTMTFWVDVSLEDSKFLFGQSRLI